MRGWMALFLLSAVLCVASAITGIQSFDCDSRTGMAITGDWRTLALVYAATSVLLRYLSPLPYRLEGRLRRFLPLYLMRFKRSLAG